MASGNLSKFEEKNALRIGLAVRTALLEIIFNNHFNYLILKEYKNLPQPTTPVKFR
jgi:hypothetical protein